MRELRRQLAAWSGRLDTAVEGLSRGLHYAASSGYNPEYELVILREVGEVGRELREASEQSHRTLDQNAGFHAMIAPWAKSEGHRVDDLKRDLLAEVFGRVERRNLRGQIELVPAKPHTSDLTRAEFSELIDRTLEIAAECGVTLVAPEEWARGPRV